MEYSRAPYNFIPLHKDLLINRYESYEDLPKHNEVNGELLSGNISFSITNESPMIVAGDKDGKEAHFNRLPSGEYAIPGSTIKGLVRSNMTILGKGYLREGSDFDNPNIMYRIVMKDNNSAKSTMYHNSIEGVKACYIKNESGTYYLYNTTFDQDRIFDDKGNELDCNFYKIKRDSLGGKGSFNNKTYNICFNKDANDKEKAIFSDDPRYNRVLEQTGTRYRKAMIILPGESTANKNNAIVIGAIGNKRIKIDNKDIDIFNKDFAERKSTITCKDDTLPKKEQDAETDRLRRFYSMPESGQIKPFFYVVIDGRYYFGRSRMIRIPFEKSIGDGLMGVKINEDEIVFDYPNSILGFTTDSTSYKSRVNFDDFILKNEIEIIDGKVLPGCSPRPSNYYDYIIQKEDEQVKAYYGEFQMRGIKQYWLIDNGIDKLKTECGDMDTMVYPLESGKIFQGKVHFNNLYPDELGLLLWSIRLENDSRQQIGMGKPYGFGRIKIDNIELSIDKDKKYTVDGFFGKKEDSVASVEEYIEKYKNSKYVLEKIKNINLDSDIEDFIYMHNENQIRKFSEVKYMELNEGRGEMTFALRKQYDNKGGKVGVSRPLKNKTIPAVPCLKTVKQIRNGK